MSALLRTPRHIRRCPPWRVPTAALAPLAAALLLSLAPATRAGASEPGAASSASRCPAQAVDVADGEPLCLARLEVTVDAYAACVAARRCTPRATRAQCNGERQGLGRHPANCVDLAQAERYCAFSGGRLPTSDEWERAARAALPHVDRSPGADPPADICWNQRTQNPGTCEVGSFCAPSAICDLAGNVAEWTSTTVELPGGKRLAIVRGGGWIFDPLAYAAELDPAFRRRVDPTSRLVDLGFRCAFDPGGTTQARRPN